MSDYSKSTNFTTKDTLPTGNAGKILKGTELDTEFVAIASAISSKADISSPSLLGTPTSPTATVGSDTTQIANTAFVKTAVDALGTIGTMAAQAASSVAITGGSVTGITDITVADGGTGRSTLTDKAVLIGAGTGAVNSVSPGTVGNVLKSDGTNWTSAAPTVVKGLGLGGEVYNDVTGSRSFGSTYTNSYSYPIQVSAYTNYTNGTPYCQAFVNGSRIAWWQWQYNGAGAIGGVIFIVPPGATYRIDGGGSLQSWFELY